MLGHLNSIWTESLKDQYPLMRGRKKGFINR